MKNHLIRLFTNNIGLKILSLIAASVLWLVVVNVDDPVISRTYSGIPVEITNGDAVTNEGKTYEILDDSNSISVTVSAKRSVIEQMSKDYIRATANMKDLTFMDTVPIEVRSTRFSDRIEAISARTKNLQVLVEDLARKQLTITVITSGVVNSGYVLGDVKPTVNMLSVSGPESVVRSIAAARAEIDVTGMSNDVSTTAVVHLYDANGDVVTDSMVNSSVTEVHVDAQILSTKDVNLTASYIGNAADGYDVTGVVECNPATVKIAGKSKVLDEIDSIVIPETEISIAGVSENVVHTVDISKYLPDGVRLADAAYDGEITVTVYIEPMITIPVDVPFENISIENVPAGYSAYLVEIGSTKRVDVSGVSDVLMQLEPTTITGTIDAASLIPRLGEKEEYEEGTVHVGSNDGTVVFTTPTGVHVSGQVLMEVILNPVENGTESTLEQ